MNLPDVQNQQSKIPLKIEKVGVEGIQKYIIVKRKSYTYHFICSINSYCELSEAFKGVNMSRFAEAIYNISNETYSIEEYAMNLAEENKKRHNAESEVFIKSKFPLKFNKLNGKTEDKIFDIICSYNTKTRQKSLTLNLVGMSSCPCSKELCNGKTHNQKSYLDITIFFDKEEDIDAGELALLLQNAFSSPVFTLLKREDEKQVVEHAIENSKFVEDIIREAIILMKEKYNGKQIKIKVTNDESIHEHKVSAYWEGLL